MGCWPLMGADLCHPGRQGGPDPEKLGAVSVAPIFPQG